ncbi:hypothetical protein M9Y10_041664 [Tritrichomonas musculus]|uniref:DUF4201 domain-containing protein n=1 Tax=Tritrichomonas musculus TaxID=1915356 RepID=A0ABR2K556_9EUKA
MISPPSSSPSSPSPRKIKSSNQSSSAPSINETNENDNDHESILEDNKSENEEENNETSITDDHKSIMEENEDQENGANLSGNDLQSNEIENNEEEMNEEKSDNNNEKSSQHSTVDNDDMKENLTSEATFAHENEEESSRPLSPVPLTQILDTGVILTAKDPIKMEEQNETDNFVEEEEKNEPKGKNPNDVQYWVDEAMQLQPLDGCNPRILGKVIDGIRKERDNFIELGLYQDSVQANEALTNALEYKDSIYKKNIQKKKQDELQARLDDAKNHLKDLQSTVTRIEPNMASSFEKEMNNLIKRQNHELNRLTVEWESPQKLRMYNRSSANLRNLRTQSILLFNSHRFDEMELASRTADLIEENESTMNQRRLENDFQDALNKMLDRHQNERQSLIVAQKVQKEKYEAAKNHDFMIAQRRIDKLEREIEDSKDPEKVWIHYSRAEARGPPGPRPKARQGRKNCLQAIQTKDFNTLNLPPLVDNPKWKLDSPRSPKERQERAKEIAALSRTGGSAALVAIASRRSHAGVRASYGSPRGEASKKRKV